MDDPRLLAKEAFFHDQSVHDGENPRLAIIVPLGFPIIGKQAPDVGTHLQTGRVPGPDHGVNLTGLEHAAQGFPFADKLE